MVINILKNDIFINFPNLIFHNKLLKLYNALSVYLFKSEVYLIPSNRAIEKLNNYLPFSLRNTFPGSYY